MNKNFLQTTRAEKETGSTTLHTLLHTETHLFIGRLAQLAQAITTERHERAATTTTTAAELQKVQALQEQQYHALLFPSEAIFAFMGWLTSRKEVSGPFSAAHDAGQAAILLRSFCQMQGWALPREGYHQHLQSYTEEE